ncbi:O-antigen ligase family protein [Roseomonas sp. OT10]|uniref:O-antigen ligase family protein n=1 Tax=Roseomonas cutis TaxID=2897332 RepID=UPI001E4613C3|nr:O-antigen ligase family protein [Roseomonas sp. OT10]UFN46970.1 O-antigen ligase family protein [Roseomonas sp. OT10]
MQAAFRAPPPVPPAGLSSHPSPGTGLPEPPAPWTRPIWWIALAGAMSTDMLGWAFQNPIVSPGLFVLVWAGAFVAWPRTMLEAATMSWLPWLMPVLGFLSFLWSREPLISAKMGVEMFFTVLTTMMMARQLPARNIIAILQLVCLIGGIASLVDGTTRDGLIGIYGSKNSLSYYAGLLMITSVAVLVDGKQPWIFRLLAPIGIAASPALLIQGNSVGALAACAGATMVMLAFTTIRLVPDRFRASYVMLFITITLLVGAIVGTVIAQEKAVLLEMVGKSENLTGRGYLWARATELIQERPLLGYGYYAFWVQDYVEAEGLWRYSHVAARMGFHFHNLYYQTAIDLGLLGLGCMIVVLVLTAVAVLVRAIRHPGGDSIFFVGFLVFLYARTISEVEFNYVFQFTQQIFAMTWIYATQSQRLAPIWAGLRPGRRAVSRPVGAVRPALAGPRQG